MIFYRPTDGDVHARPIAWRPRTAFLMTQLGNNPPEIVESVRTDVKTLSKASRFKLVDAESVTTGKDFLLNIWNVAVACPVGIAILHDDIPLALPH